MRYLKLFESFINTVKFYRFSKEDFLNGESEATYYPKSRNTWGSTDFNKYLVELGFPDRENCIHFMDEKAFNSGQLSWFKGIYGQWVYEIEVDENSKLGWSFCLVINDWYYMYYKHKLSDNPVVQDVRRFVSELEMTDDEEITEKRLKYVYEKGIIGSGTLDDLKKSPLYGKQPVYVWTTEPVKMKLIDGPNIKTKEPKGYKNEPVLNSEDFFSRGIQPQDIGQFYQSDFGKQLKRFQPTARFELKREEALKLLDSWIQSK